MTTSPDGSRKDNCEYEDDAMAYRRAEDKQANFTLNKRAKAVRSKRQKRRTPVGLRGIHRRRVRKMQW